MERCIFIQYGLFAFLFQKAAVPAKKAKGSEETRETKASAAKAE